jgi:hypothetical protein
MTGSVHIKITNLTLWVADNRSWALIASSNSASNMRYPVRLSFSELSANVRFKVVAAQSTDWHQDFGGSNVAQHLQLPLVWSGPAVLQTVADEF